MNNIKNNIEITEKNNKKNVSLRIWALPVSLLIGVAAGFSLAWLWAFVESLKFKYQALTLLREGIRGSVRLLSNSNILRDSRFFQYIDEAIRGGGLVGKHIMGSDGGEKYFERLWKEMYYVTKTKANLDEGTLEHIKVVTKLNKVLKRHAEAYEYIKTVDNKQKLTTLLGNRKKTRLYAVNDSYNEKYPWLNRKWGGESMTVFNEKESQFLEFLVKHNIIHSGSKRHKELTISNYESYKTILKTLFGKVWATKNESDELFTAMKDVTTESEKIAYAYRIILDKTRIADKGDGFPNVFNFGAWLDFTDPASLEFKGIYELYHFVMFKLLFIFCLLLILAILSVYYCVRVTVYSVIGAETKEFDDFSQNIFEITKIAFFLILRKKEKESKYLKQIFKTLGIFNKVSLEEITKDLLVSTSKTVNVGRQTSMYDKFSKVDSIFTPTAFWVHFSKLEFIWTIIPCFILLLISFPSFTLALSLDETHKPVSWIKITGNQWYWMYEYSTYDENITLYSNIVYGSDLTNNSLRLLEPDICITLINNKHTRLLITSSDVIHSWTIPALGLKVDACPGRINSVSILPTRPGVYYGQCSEICGVNHGFMPIVMEVVP